MVAPVQVGTKSTVAGGVGSITTNSNSATGGNKLVLLVSWMHLVGGSSATISAPSGWSTALSVASGFGSNARLGWVCFYKTAAGGVESPVMNGPSGSGLYAQGIIIELPAASVFDSTASSSSIVTTNNATASTGCTVPNTGTLTNANSTIFTGASVGTVGAGLANNHMASNGSFTQALIESNTSTTLGALIGYKSVTVNTAIGVVYTWDIDAGYEALQAGTVVFSDAAAGATGGGPLTGGLANSTLTEGRLIT